MKYSEVVNIIFSRLKSVSEFGEWLAQEARPDYVDDAIAYIRIGEFGVALVNRFGGEDFFLIDVYVSELAGAEWIYRDWIVFCLEMKEVGFPIEEGCLDFDSEISGERIWLGNRIFKG